MKWTLAFCLCIAFAAVASGDVLLGYTTQPAPAVAPNTTPVVPMQVVPVQPMQAIAVVPSVVAVPSTMQVQTLQPQLNLRWGIFRRRLVPRYTYTLGPSLTYRLMAGPPSQPSFRQTQ